jgi:heme/copper-type cytochrome/quinol oxidase subunit 1
MQDRFNFNRPGLLKWLASVVVVAAPLSYAFAAWFVPVVLGFGAMMLAGARGRVRVGRWVSYPEPTQSEGSIAAVGVALIAAGVIAFLANKVYPWQA